MGCPYDDDETVPQPTDSDRLFARIILALQAESELDKIGITGLTDYMKLAAERMPQINELLPVTEEEVNSCINRLTRFGYVAVFEDKFVAINYLGLLICGPLRISKPVADSFGEKIDTAILSRA